MRGKITTMKEINQRITAGNKCYFLLVSLFKLKLLSRKTKIRLNKVLVIRPIQLYYMSVKWVVKEQRRKKTDNILEKILQRIFGPKRNTESNEYERRTNAD